MMPSWENTCFHKNSLFKENNICFWIGIFMDRRLAAVSANPLHEMYCNICEGTSYSRRITFSSNCIITQPFQLSFDLALMISLPSSELISENAILQVTVKTKFPRLYLITRYTWICVRIMLPLFCKCTPTQRALF